MAGRLRLAGIAIALALALPATATAERQYSYLVTVEADETGEDFVPREAGHTSDGSIQATWRGAFPKTFVVDDDARTARVGAHSVEQEVAITHTATVSGGDGGGGDFEYDCFFGNVQQTWLFDLIGEFDAAGAYAEGVIELIVGNNVLQVSPPATPEFPCTGTPAKSMRADIRTVPGTHNLCQARLPIPLSRLGEERFVVEFDRPPQPGCDDPIGFGSYTARGHYTVTLELNAGPPADLVVRRLSGTGEIVNDRRVWRVQAEIANDGTGDSTPAEVQLEGARVVENVGAPAFARLGGAPLPALRPGETTTIEWVAGAPGPNAVDFDQTAESNLLRVVIDPAGTVREVTKDNNARRIWKLSCDAASVATPPAFVEVAEGPDQTVLTEPDYNVILGALPETTAEEKVRAVLCYIQLEAQRRAKSPPGTMRGTRFESALATRFLRRYLRAPSKRRGRKATAAIGETASRFRTLPVPPSFRRRYRGLPDEIVPASEFLAQVKYPLLSSRPGRNHRFIPLIDGPFLVGVPNRGKGLNDDYADGGRNHTNVMHWGTGVRYGHVGADALQAMFIGYELFHLEGWDVFGEDPLNDLIAEEAGRMLGARLKAGSIRNRRGLVRALDADFREARAWVGAMVRLRQAQLDELIEQREPPRGLFHWKRRDAIAPWSAAESMLQAFEDADPPTVAEMRRTRLVARLVEIYTLIYEAEERERLHGSPLTPLVRDIVQGVYDDQFRALRDLDFHAKWNIRLR